MSVITHTAYPADAKKAVEKDLQDNYVDKGKSLVADFSVDPQIIGGRIYCFEDNIMDMSVKQMVCAALPWVRSLHGVAEHAPRLLRC